MRNQPYLQFFCLTRIYSLHKCVLMWNLLDKYLASLCCRGLGENDMTHCEQKPDADWDYSWLAGKPCFSCRYY